MRRRALPLLLLFPLLLAATTARAQGFNWGAYERRTLAELIAKYDNKELVNPTMKDGSTLFGARFPSRVRVKYTGECRTILDTRKRFVKDWTQVHAHDMSAALFESEMKFTQDGAEFWLPVQGQVMRYIEKELKRGQLVDLYVILAGGRKLEGKWDWVILVNEFSRVIMLKPAEGV